MRLPVVSLKDLIGKTIGINNETQGVALEKLGMHPVFLPATDAAMAISGGKIDGVAKSPSILFDFGITRFATYHYLLGTSVVPLALLMSRKKFDSLPKQAQAIIQKYSGEWAAGRWIDGYREDNKRALERLKADPRRKVINPSPVDLHTAQAAFKSVIEEWAAKGPAEQRASPFGGVRTRKNQVDAMMRVCTGLNAVGLCLAQRDAMRCSARGEGAKQ